MEPLTLTPFSTVDDPLREVLLAKYVMPKAEQKSRIVVYDRLMYATLATLAAATAASIIVARVPQLLLPPPCAVLGWTYLVNDENISAIEDYLRDHIGPRLARTLGGVEVLDWESVHRDRLGRWLRKPLQHGVDLVMFLIAALLLGVGYWLTEPVASARFFASVVGLAAAVLLGIHMVSAADLTAASIRR